MHWLVYQTLINEEDLNATSLSYKIKITPVIRKVEAASKEEAIGKFIIDTSSLEFKRRVEPIDCIAFDDLKAI